MKLNCMYKNIFQKTLVVIAALLIVPFAIKLNTFAKALSQEVITTEDVATMPLLDVLIIGGGPAGLAVATGLARQLYTAVIFDSGVYRNALTKHMHNVPTWDHRDPAEFRAKALADLKARYDTVQLEKVQIEAVNKTRKGHFEATDSNGRVWTGRKLVLAMGAKDIPLDIPGYEDCWARGMYDLYFSIHSPRPLTGMLTKYALCRVSQLSLSVLPRIRGTRRLARRYVGDWGSGQYLRGSPPRAHGQASRLPGGNLYGWRR